MTRFAKSQVEEIGDGLAELRECRDTEVADRVGERPEREADGDICTSDPATRP